MKKIIQRLVAIATFTILIVGMFGTMSLVAFAADDDDDTASGDSQSDTTEETKQTTTLPLKTETVETYVEGGLPGPAVGDNRGGIALLEDLVLENLLGYIKIFVAAIGVLYITLTGIKMVVQGEDEEAISTAKRSIIYMIIAFVLVSMSQELALIFDMGDDTLLENPQEILQRVKLFDADVEVIMTFVKYVIGSFATFMAITSGLKLVTSGGDDEETSKNKKSLLYSASGLLLLYVGDIFVNRVLYRVDKTVYTSIEGIQYGADPYAGVEEIVGITNFILTFLGPLMVLMLVISGVMYLTSGGEDEGMEKAKRILIATIVGMVIIFGAYAAVNTFISGQLPSELTQ